MVMPAAAQDYYQTPVHVIAAAVSLLVIDLVVVTLRVLARRKNRQRFGCDDWLMIPATILTLGIIAGVLYGTTTGALAETLQLPADFDGNPLTLKTDQLRVTMQIQWAFTMMLPLALGFIKMSIVFFYMRIFTPSATSTLYRCLIGLNVLIGLWTLAFFLAGLFECNLDFWAAWGSTLEFTTYCPSGMKPVVALCVTDLVTDIMIMVAPIIPVCFVL